MTDDLDTLLAEEKAPVSLGDIYRAIEASGGNMTAAAKALGRRRSTIEARVNASPPLVALLSELRAGLVDQAEGNIVADVARGDQAASKFVLQTLGKDRGYVVGVGVGGLQGDALKVEIIKFAPEEAPSNG